MSKKKIIILTLAAVAIILIAYFVFFRQKSLKDLPESTIPGDDDAYKEIYKLLNGRYGTEINWLTKYVQEVLEGKIKLAPQYMVNGQVTKTGALLHTYAAGFAPDKMSEPGWQQFHDSVYDVFYRFRDANDSLIQLGLS